MLLRAILGSAALYLAAPGLAQAQRADSMHKVSIVQLLARPEVFDGKQVQVQGYIHLEFEGNGIYLHREDQLRSLYRNGLWVQFKRGAKLDEPCSGRYVLVEGIFQARHHGHMGLWSGAITDITRCVPWGEAGPGQASLLGRWRLQLQVTGRAAQSAGPHVASGSIELRHEDMPPAPARQEVYRVTYDSALQAMFGAPRAGPAQAMRIAQDSVRVVFNPFLDHGAFHLAGVSRGDTVSGQWHRTNFADDGYRGTFIMVRN